MKTLDVVAILGRCCRGCGGRSGGLIDGRRADHADRAARGRRGRRAGHRKRFGARIPAAARGHRTYRIASGDKEGQSEPHIVQRLENDPSGADWRYTVGTTGDVLIKQTEDGSLTVVSEQDNAQAVITRHQPAEPGVLVGLAPGDSRSASIAVAVSDISSPQVVSHNGTLEVTYSHLGAYKVTTPAGTYDAALIKWTYQGKVGPADVDDTQYRFFAENVGMVATVDKLSVAAPFVYHEHTKSGKVLARVSARGQGAPGSAAR